jgi:hypothetical protein
MIVILLLLFITCVVCLTGIGDGSLACDKTACCDLSYIPGIGVSNDSGDCYCAGDTIAANYTKYEIIPKSECINISANNKQCRCYFKLKGNTTLFSISSVQQSTCVAVETRFTFKEPLCPNYDVKAWNAIGSTVNDINPWMISTIVLSSLIGCLTLILITTVFIRHRKLKSFPREERIFAEQSSPAVLN